MSNRFSIWGFVAIFVVAMFGAAVADIPIGNREDGIRVIDHLKSKAAPAPAEAIQVDPRTLPDVEVTEPTDAGCQTIFNTCLIPYYIWSMPGAPFIYDIDTTVVPWDTIISNRVSLGEGMDPDPGVYATECTVGVVAIFVYDWLDTNYKATSVPRVNVHFDDGAGYPGAIAASYTYSVSETQAGIDAFDFMPHDFSGDMIAIPAGQRFHVTIDFPSATPGVDGVYLLSDGGLDDAANCPEGAANTKGTVFYTVPGVWETHAEHWSGFQFGLFVTADVCCNPIPGDCANRSNTCYIPYYIWSVPGTANARIAMGEGFQLDPSGLSECTALTAWIVVYDWIDTGIKEDIVVALHADDGSGLPGAILAEDTIPAAVVDANLFAFLPVDFTDNVGAPFVAAAGDRMHVTVEAPFSTPGTSGIFMLSDGGDDDAANCPEGAANENGSVFYTDVGFWESHDTHFGGFTFGTFIDLDVCCEKVIFPPCAPGADLAWETQGNGIGRTNATTAGLSDQCNLITIWSVEPGGDVQAIQPIIAGEFVLATATDSLHCRLRTDGSRVWAFGGFPYIVGDIRGAVTVDLAEPGPGGLGVVYVGGAAAQSFSKLDLASGNVIWSRNVLAADPPNLPLPTGATGWTSSILHLGHVYFTNETGSAFKLDAITGIDAAGSPLTLPDVVNGKIAYNAMASNGVKLYVGDADGIATDGSIYQIDMATFTIDWQLTNPSFIFTGDIDFYEPEGFPGSFAIEGDILYYHSLIRDDASGFSHFPQTGALGAIDLTVENGTGNGVMWVNPSSTGPLAAPGTVPSSFNYSGPAVGEGFIFTTARGFFGGTTEPDGVSAYSKTLGTRVWYHGYTNLGNQGGVGVNDDVRCDVPATVYCDPMTLQPYVFTGHVDGYLRLFNGNTGVPLWRRPHTGRQRGTAVVDEAIATLTRNGGPLTGGGSITYKEVGLNPRPRLQIDSQFVFRTATPGDGSATDAVVGAIQNTGCATLNISAYLNKQTVPPLTQARVTNVNPNLARAAENVSRSLGGFDAMLNAMEAKDLAIAKTALDIDDESMVRTFARMANPAAPQQLFLTAVTGPATVAAGAAADVTITYDETGLTNNTGYLNYIEYVTDDPDYWEQDLSATILVPFTTVNLFIGCPDASALMTLGRGTMWITNWGAEGGAGNFSEPDATDGLVVDGVASEHYDGGWYAAVNDDDHWAFEGCSVGGYPRRGGEWGPTLPCGVVISTNDTVDCFSGATVSYEEATFRMIDLASPNGYFPPSVRQLGGVILDVHRVGPQDPAYGNIVLTEVVFTNEAGAPYDIPGDMDSVLFGIATDWDMVAGTDNYMYKFANGYAIHDGGVADGSAAAHAGGHARLDADHHSIGSMGSGASATFMMADILNDQAHGDTVYTLMNDPQTWADNLDVTSTFNTDIGAYWTAARWAPLADGASETMYMAMFMVINGSAYETWSTGAEYEAVIANTVAKAKAYAGLSDGDVNCDGVVDLADVVRLGNILDGSFDPTGTGGEFSGDVDCDCDIDEDDYTILYDAVSVGTGTVPCGWKF